MTELETLRQQLAEAEARYHAIMTKQQITQTAYSLGGQNAVSKAALDPRHVQQYIGRLKMQISRLEGRGGLARQARW